MFEVICYGLLSAFILGVNGNGDIGPGEWNLINIKECDNNEQYDVSVEVKQYRLNRSHDCFDAKVTLQNPLDKRYAFSSDMCKNVDGGCKLFQQLANDCFVDFIEEHAAKNAERALAIAGMDPPKFPMDTGEYLIEKFEFDYCELPREAFYGTFTVQAFLLEHNQKKACVEVVIEFVDSDKKCGMPSDDDDEYEDK